MSHMMDKTRTINFFFFYHNDEKTKDHSIKTICGFGSRLLFYIQVKKKCIGDWGQHVKDGFYFFFLFLSFTKNCYIVERR